MSPHQDNYQHLPANIGVFHSERLLDFSDESINIGVQKSQKQLACAKFHTQKLRCVRKSSGEHACDRCQATNVECVARQLQRMGRPADYCRRKNHNGSASINGARYKNKYQYGGASRKIVSTTSSGSESRHLSVVDSDCGVVALSPSADGDSTSSCRGAGAGVEFAELSPNNIGVAMCPPVDVSVEKNKNVGKSSSNDSSSSTIVTQITPTSYTGSDLDIWSSWAVPNQLNSYANSPFAGLENSNSLFPQYNDLPASFFAHGVDTTIIGASTEPDSITDLQSQLDDTPNDPVEQLTKLHLELYRCLTSVKAQLFQTTERFIDALTSYVDKNLPPSNTEAVSASLISSSDNQELMTTDEADTATGLMICVSSKFSTSWSSSLKPTAISNVQGSYVEIRFGSFAAKTDRMLSARLLGQYLLHLLCGISEAVKKAIASRQPYARAIVDARRVEAKLKERIAITFHDP
ncbi:uncharacterized protein EAE97_004465 [Botrytis byssoidea]|uniref:Zn(2)-C6 fungal-type domain-containing protein n=1 Tax=Botrytis byssoidea TaxID=139641 RepID=A0A9P5IT05_9HELO|nr:uncharacterized protein EAE97_004465 [Botrytis byssoidea]KAF7947216.1 hypothetical protein EAE97_004465 [Botrytis byssoidea]